MPKALIYTLGAVVVLGGGYLLFKMANKPATVVVQGQGQQGQETTDMQWAQFGVQTAETAAKIASDIAGMFD
jgi:uncharacterized protein YggE